MKNLNKNLIKELKKKRIELSFSLQMLAKYIPCTVRTLWSWENCLAKPRKNKLEEWQRALERIENGEILCKPTRGYTNRRSLTVSRIKALETKERRLALKIPQSTTSIFILDRSRSYLNKLENGTRKMTIREYETLMKFYDEMEAEK